MALCREVFPFSNITHVVEVGQVMSNSDEEELPRFALPLTPRRVSQTATVAAMQGRIAIFDSEL